MKRIGAVAVIGYTLTIVAANWALHHIGNPSPFPGAPNTLPVGFGLEAPSGVYFVALALVLRNVVQRQLGRRVAVAAIIVGALLSWATSDGAVALASGVAFLCSEGLDMTVYTPLRRHGQLRAVLPASLLGGAVDSAVFLAIAFHSESFWQAQMLGKAWGVLAAAVILGLAEARANPKAVEFA